MNTECPNCTKKNAYCDGINYVCPDCEYEWPCPEITNDDNEDFECPNCKKTDEIYNDSTGQADYICNNCGYRWNDDDDDDNDDDDDDDE